jgi:hypothetical protein
MIDLDYGPGVMMLWIAVVFALPTLYGMFIVDAHWRKHQQEGSKDDVFN